MAELINSLEDQISQTATTLCYAWCLSLKNGPDILMTDHDDPLEISGEVFLPNQSLNATDRDQHLDFAADGGAIQTHFDLPMLSEDEIKNGALDGATLTQYIVNWRNPEQHKILSKGRIGPIKISDFGFEAEWLGETTKLERNIGRVFSVQCDASFGDARCGLNAEDFPDSTICPRSFQACRDQFNNARNFRGFPYLIGDDALQSGSKYGEPRDGSSRYS